MERELGRAPSEEEVACRMKLPKKKVAIIKKAIRVHNAIPQPDDGESGWSLDEIMLAGKTKSPETEMAEAEELQSVMGTLDQLDPREASVLRMRFGLDGEEPRTLREIGEELGLTRERVRQIERESLSKMSERLCTE